MAVHERDYHKYIAAEEVAAHIGAARRAQMRALNCDGDIIEAEYQRGKAEGLDKAFEICLRMFAKELEEHRAELEVISSERDELINRYRWRFWRS